jgi:hypothetical protein
MRTALKKVTEAFLRRQLAKGMKAEREHSSDPKVVRKIAIDHLWEFPDYYDRLEKMERQARKHWTRKGTR